MYIVVELSVESRGKLEPGPIKVDAYATNKISHMKIYTMECYVLTFRLAACALTSPSPKSPILYRYVICTCDCQFSHNMYRSLIAREYGSNGVHRAFNSHIAFILQSHVGMEVAVVSAASSTVHPPERVASNFQKYIACPHARWLYQPNTLYTGLKKNLSSCLKTTTPAKNKEGARASGT